MTTFSEFVNYLTDQLSSLGLITQRRMFGCTALYKHDVMFALVDGDDRLFVRADDINRTYFIKADCRAFTYESKGKTGETRDISLSYFEPPESVFDDSDELLFWAKLGVESAMRAPQKNPRKKVHIKHK